MPTLRSRPGAHKHERVSTQTQPQPTKPLKLGGAQPSAQQQHARSAEPRRELDTGCGAPMGGLGAVRGNPVCTGGGRSDASGLTVEPPEVAEPAPSLGVLSDIESDSRCASGLANKVSTRSCHRQRDATCRGLLLRLRFLCLTPCRRRSLMASQRNAAHRVLKISHFWLLNCEI